MSRPGVPFAYVICGTPRTGGNWLCSLLRDANVGDPGEFLQWRVRSALLREYRLVPKRYMSGLWAHRARGGAFGIKVHWEERRVPWFGDFDDLVPPSPTTWIHLTRDDVDAQARSLLTANETSVWFEPFQPHIPLDEYRVVAAVEGIEANNAAWRAWFAEHGFEPVSVTYEQLVADPDGTVARLAKAIRGSAPRG